jgi:hypothetical protein
MKTLLAFLVAGVAAATAGTAAAEGYRLLQKVEVVPDAGIFDYAAMDAGATGARTSRTARNWSLSMRIPTR